MPLISKIQKFLDRYNLDLSSLFLLAVVVTFPLKESPLVIVAFFVSQMIRIVINKNYRIKTNTFFCFFMALFLLDLLGLIYTSDYVRGFSILSRQYLIIPFVIIFSIYPPKNYLLVFKVYIIAILIYLLLHEIDIIYRFFYKSNVFPLSVDLFFSYRYTGARLTELTGIQNAFFGMYIVFANILLLFFLERTKKNLHSFGIVLIIAFQSFFILQLVAKTAIAMNLLIIIPTLLLYLIKNKNIKSFILILTIGLSVTIFTVKYLKLPFQRIQERFEELSSEDTNLITRKKVWETAFTVIEDNLLIGAGTGDVHIALEKEYSKRGFSSKKNAHNQFLDYLLRYGVVGFLLFISFFLYSIYYAIKNKSPILFLYTFLLIGSFMTENIFNRMWGVTFYATFTYMLYLFTNQEQLTNEI